MPSPKTFSIEPYVLFFFFASASGLVALSDYPETALQQICTWCTIILSGRTLLKRN